EALPGTAIKPAPVPGRYTALASGGVSGQRGVFVYDPEAVAGHTSWLTRSPARQGLASYHALTQRFGCGVSGSRSPVSPCERPEAPEVRPETRPRHLGARWSECARAADSGPPRNPWVSWGGEHRSTRISNAYARSADPGSPR